MAIVQGSSGAEIYYFYRTPVHTTVHTVNFYVGFYCLLIGSPPTSSGFDPNCEKPAPGTNNHWSVLWALGFSFRPEHVPGPLQLGVIHTCHQQPEHEANRGWKAYLRGDIQGLQCLVYLRYPWMIFPHEKCLDWISKKLWKYVSFLDLVWRNIILHELASACMHAGLGIHSLSFRANHSFLAKKEQIPIFSFLKRANGSFRDFTLVPF